MTPPIDFVGILLAAVASIPGQFVIAYNSNPEVWNRVGLGMLALVGMSILGRMMARRRRRRRV